MTPASCLDRKPTESRFAYSIFKKSQKKIKSMERRNGTRAERRGTRRSWHELALPRTPMRMLKVGVTTRSARVSQGSVQNRFESHPLRQFSLLSKTTYLFPRMTFISFLAILPLYQICTLKGVYYVQENQNLCPMFVLWWNWYL